MADITFVTLTSAQRAALRQWDWYGQNPPMPRMLQPLIRRGLVEREERRGPVSYPLTMKGIWVQESIFKRDREFPADLFGEVRFPIPRYLEQDPERVYLRAGDGPVPCFECGGPTNGGLAAPPEPVPGRMTHFCRDPLCQYAFFTDPDAD